MSAKNPIVHVETLFFPVRIFLLFVVVSVCTPAVSSGQGKSYVSRHYTNENGLPQNSVKGIKIDSSGYAWLWTEAALVRFDGQRFLTVNAFADGTVFSDRIGNLFTGSGGQIVVFAGGKYYRVSKRLVWELYAPSAAELALWALDGVALQYRNFQQCLRRYEQGLIPRWAVPDPQRSDLYGMENFIATRNGHYFFNEQLQLILADTSYTRFRRVVINGLPPPAGKNWELSLLKSQYGTYLRWGKNLYKCNFNPGGDSLDVTWQLRVGDMSPVRSIGEIPGKGIFFLGTPTDGFRLFLPTPFTVLTFHDKAANNVYAHLPFGDSSVLTPKGVLPEGRGMRLEGYRNFAAFKTRDGRYMLNRWASPWESGLAVFDSALREIRYIPVNIASITAYYQQADGDIWLAAKSNRVGKLEDTAIGWMPYPPGPAGFEPITITGEGDDVLWVGGNKGLAKLNIRTGKSVRVKGLDSMTVRSVYRDTSGIMWAGTNGDGFFAIVNGRLVRMPLDRNKFLLNTHTIFEDARGFGWIPTNQGLFQVKMDDLRQYVRNPRGNIYYHLYTQASGLLTNEFNGGCSPVAIVLGNGKVSLPSLNGVVQFDPQTVMPAEPDAPIRIDAVGFNGQLVTPGNDSLVIPGNTTRLTISVSSPYYGISENQVIRYQLKGLDASFYDLPADGKITYNKLPHGRYELVLQKAGGFGGKMVRESLYLFVAPLFYETLLFKLLLGLAGLAIILGAMRLRTGALHRRQKRLENEVRERTLEQHRLIGKLEVVVSDLKASKESLQQKNSLQEQLALMITHDLQSPLRFLEDVSLTLKKAVNKGQQTVQLELSNDLQQAVKKMHRFVREFGLWLKTKGEDFYQKGEPVNLLELLEESTLFFMDIAGRRNIRLLIECPPALTVWVNRQMLTIVIRNLVDNAIKYTDDGEVAVRVHAVGEEVFISVADTGGGFSPETLRRVRSFLQHPGDIPYGTSESGYGYRFIADFCKVMGLEAAILTSGENGTVVQIGRIIIHQNQNNEEAAVKKVTDAPVKKS